MERGGRIAQENLGYLGGEMQTQLTANERQLGNDMHQPGWEKRRSSIGTECPLQPKTGRLKMALIEQHGKYPVQDYIS